MTEINKINDEKIKIDGIEISIKDYNENLGLYKDDEIATRKEFKELWEEFYNSKQKPGSKDYYTTEEYLKEIEKTKKVNRNLYDTTGKFIQEGPSEKGTFHKIWSVANGDPSNDSETDIIKRVESNNKVWKSRREKKLFEFYKEAIEKMRQIATQKEQTGNGWGNDYNDPFKDQDRGELGKRANQIKEYREKTVQEIKNVLNQDPQIDNSELEPGNRGWEESIWHSHIALGEKEINDIKNRVLADIEAKRNAKTGNRQGEDQKTDSPSQQQPDSKKPELDEKDKNSFQDLKNKTLADLTENELAAGLRVATRMEGEKEYQGEEEIKAGEDELIKKNPQLYCQTVIEALKERIKDNGIDNDKLDEETKQLINGEITDANEVKRIKSQAVKRIWEAGAQNKWSSFFSKAQTALQKAKKNLTEQVKKEIKAIQGQLKELKSGANSYLTSFYQKDKSNIEKLEKDLASAFTQSKKTQEPKSGFFYPEVIIPLAVVTVLVAAVAIVVIRNRRQKKIKEIVE